MGGRTRKLRNAARRQAAYAPVAETAQPVVKKKKKKKTTKKD